MLDNNTGEYKFSKLGRMLKEEAEKVVPMIQKALEFMPETQQKLEAEADSEESTKE